MNKKPHDVEIYVKQASSNAAVKTYRVVFKHSTYGKQRVFASDMHYTNMSI